MTTVNGRVARGIPVVGLILVGSPTFTESARAQEGPVDLLSQYDIRIDGGDSAVLAGFSVSGAGDVNDDGTPDVIVGAPLADDGLAKPNAGRAFVIFGDPTPQTIDLFTLGAAGFRIDGAAEGEELGRAAAGAGDVNDDGLDDVIVGAPAADNNSRANSGSAYVVFGKATTSTVELSSLGSGFPDRRGSPQRFDRHVGGGSARRK